MIHTIPYLLWAAADADPLQDAQVNSLTSRLPNASTKMFLMHAIYGFGATVSPLISTEFVKRVPNRVYLYFCVSVGLGLATGTTLIVVFRGRTDDQVVGKRRPDAVPDRQEGSTASQDESEMETPETGEKEAAPIRAGGSSGKMKAIMQTPAVHYMAFYILIYVSFLSGFVSQGHLLIFKKVGIEVAIGGWAVSNEVIVRGLADGRRRHSFGPKEGGLHLRDTSRPGTSAVGISFDPSRPRADVSRLDTRACGPDTRHKLPWQAQLHLHLVRLPKSVGDFSLILIVQLGFRTSPRTNNMVHPFHPR